MAKRQAARSTTEKPENGPESVDQTPDAPDVPDDANDAPEGVADPSEPTLTDTSNEFVVGQRPSSLDPVPENRTVEWFEDYEESGEYMIVLNQNVYRKFQYPGSQKFGRTLAYHAGQRVPKSVLDDRQKQEDDSEQKTDDE